MPALLVDIDGRDGRRYLLDECQPILQILFICPVDQIFQCRTAQSAGIPSRHSLILPFMPRLTKRRANKNGAKPFITDILTIFLISLQPIAVPYLQATSPTVSFSHPLYTFYSAVLLSEKPFLHRHTAPVFDRSLCLSSNISVP